MKHLIIIITLVLSACTSGQRNRGQLTQPKDATVSILNLCIDQFDTARTKTLQRYLSGNPRWEVLQNNGKIYAIRKEMQGGKYQTSLNGFYSFEDSLGIHQTRVIISFEQYYGFGRDERGITFTDSKNKDLTLTVEGEHSGSPGYSSYLIIEGNYVNIEIFDQTKDVKRKFTQKTIHELNDELSNVLKYEKEINANGVMPITEYYPIEIDTTFYNILDGMQPGIYIVQAGLKLDKEGIVYTKAFDNKTNERLSEDRMTPRTTRKIGWSKNGQTIFQYESGLTVYEGDWDHEYEARFEIWFKEKNGNEKKLVEKTRMINGWRR